MSSEDAPDGDGWEPAQIIDPERDRQIDDLNRTVAQLLIVNARLARGRKKRGRAPDMATETFSALAMVLLRRGVEETQLLEDLSEAYRLYQVPRPQDRVKETLALAKKRLAEQSDLR